MLLSNVGWQSFRGRNGNKEPTSECDTENTMQNREKSKSRVKK